MKNINKQNENKNCYCGCSVCGCPVKEPGTCGICVCKYRDKIGPDNEIENNSNNRKKWSN